MRLLKPLELLILAVTLVFFGGLLLRSQQATVVPLYLEPNQPIERRVNDLLSRMTLKEKVGHLNLPCVYVDDLGKDIPTKMEPASDSRLEPTQMKLAPAVVSLPWATRFCRKVLCSRRPTSTHCRKLQSPRHG